MKTMMKGLISAICFFALVIPGSSSAAPVFPEFLHENEARPEAVYKAGEQVYLFHSGAKVVKNTIHVNDILVIYRESPCCSLSEVGRVRIAAYKGGYYIKAEVVQGVIRPGDVARKGEVSCLVLAAGCDCVPAAKTISRWII
jgi:hypothetical protein